jgi:hypothetical protein
LGDEALEICDDDGHTLFHYAVGCLDDSAILKLMEKGAPLIKEYRTEVELDDDDEDAEWRGVSFVTLIENSFK